MFAEMDVSAVGVPMFSEKTTTGPETPGLMVMVNGALACPAALIALMVAFEMPAVAGVPEMRPVMLLRDKPAGNPLAAKDVGSSVAVI